MGTVIAVIILLALVMYLIVLGSNKTDEYRDEERALNRDLKRLNEQYIDRLSIYEQDNLVLINSNKALQSFKWEVENIISNDNRTSEDKVNKIKKLLSSN